MKVRNGFISNSSSSSFIIIAPVDYDYTKSEKFDEQYKRIYEAAFKPEWDKFNGQDVLIYSGYNESDCGENSISDCPELNQYLSEHNISEDDDRYYNLADDLYDSFSSFFDNTCLKIWR